MKELSILFVVVMFSSPVWATGTEGHGAMQGKNPHAEGGCASKGKIAQFHRFHQKKDQHVKVPSKQITDVDKSRKTPSLDQFI